jgi:hypothetical protein
VRPMTLLMSRSRVARLALPALLLAVLIAITGCGPEFGTKTEKKALPSAKRIGPPPAQETLAQAEDRITKAVSEKTCDGIDALVPTSRPSAATPQRCDFYKRLAGLKIVGDAEYKDLAAVIDFDNGPSFATLVLIRDDDGLYHAAVLDFSVEKPATQTKIDTQAYNDAAARAVSAVRDRNCDAYLAILDRQFGLGSAPEDEICPKLNRESNLFANALASDVLAKPELLGGNGNWAFYGLSTAYGYYTLVFANQPPTPTAPDAAPEAFVDGYLTNPAK